MSKTRAVKRTEGLLIQLSECNDDDGCGTDRRADPHVRVDVLAIDELAVAALLSGAELILIASVDFGVAVVTAVLLAARLGIHVNLVDNVSLEYLLQLGERCLCLSKQIE